MLLDSSDMELLRLAGSCQCLPFQGTEALRSLAPVRARAEALALTGLLSISRNRRYLTPTGRGYELLSHCGYPYVPAGKRPYAGSPALRRRLETGAVMLCCARAGIKTLDRVEDLIQQPVFLPAYALRTGGRNLMNASTCIGFGHWNDTAYMLHYVGCEAPGLYLSNELSCFHALASAFDPKLSTPMEAVWVGESYGALHSALTDQTPSPRHNRQGFVDFWKAYDALGIPVHLLAFDDTGVMQLGMMRQPEYRSRLAKAALGSRLMPGDNVIPDTDGFVDQSPLVIAVDMDLKRIFTVCKYARQRGSREVLVAALAEQMKALLIPLLQQEGNVRALRIGPQVWEAAFGTNGLFIHDDPPPAAGPGGELIYV